MSDSHSSPQLPPARALPLAQQRGLLLIAAAVIVGILLIVAALHRLTEPAPATAETAANGSFKPTPDQLAGFRMMTVGAGQAIDRIAATGTISVDEDHSTPVLLPYSGQVTQVLVEAGQAVVAGQPLLKIETGDFVDARNTLFAARATRETSLSALRIATDNERRQEQMFKTAGGAEKDYRQAQADLVAAQSAARSADSALGAARDRLTILGKTPREIAALESAREVSGIYAETTLHAPVSGIVSARQVAAGQYITAGGDKPVMIIADPRTLWLVAQLPESEAAMVKLGDPIEVTTPALPGRVFHAVIDNVASGLDPQTHRLPVRATIENADRALKPQMFASFEIHSQVGGTAMLVPASAVIHEGDTARVWVMGADGVLTGRTVTVTEGGDGREKILSGLRPGERIVTSGAIFINEAGLNG